MWVTEKYVSFQSPVNQKPTEVKALALTKSGLLYAGDDHGNLVEFEPSFKLNKQKLTYNEIWSLAITPDGKNAITARDNNCIIQDICKFFNRSI